MDALSILRESGLDIPFIIVSGTIGEDLAVEAMRVGVNDYLMKDNLTRLAPAIERELENAASRRGQKQAKEALRQSETTLAIAQRIAHIGCLDWDVTNNQLTWSEETYRIFARPQNQFEGTFEAFLDMVHPEDRQRVESAVREALTQAMSFVVEHRIIRPNGEERFVCEIGEVTFDESGNALGFIGTVQDITERKLAEEALHEAAKRERAMIKNALDVICTIDAEGRFTSVSPASLNVWGYEPAELIGQRYIELVAPEDVAKTNTVALNIMSGINARDFENRYQHKNGSLVHIRWSALWSEKDQLMFCVAHNITERKAAETEMRLMKRAIDSIVEGVLICDAQQPDNPTIYANAAFKKLTGYAIEEIIGRNCRILQGAETDRRRADEIKEALERGEPFRGEILNYRKDGTPFWNDLHISPISDNSGHLTNFVAIQQDITERKNTENALREAERKYASLFANAVTGIYQTTLDGRYIAANPMLARMFGYDSPEEMINEVAGERGLERQFYVEQGRREEFARLIREHGVLAGFESEIYKRNGDRIWISEHALAIRDEFGQVTGYQGTSIDITATKELEQQLRQAQKLESVGLLAGGIAHDFNNMLTAINGYSELTLRQLKADDPLRRNIEEIKKAGQRSAALTQPVISF
jgi:PAS domain S-box-containing protein